MYDDKQWWHSWTAWYPVEVDNKWVWLRDIWRKGTWYKDNLFWSYEYSLTDPRQKK